MIKVRFRHEKSIFSLTFFKLPLSVDTEKISVKTGLKNGIRQSLGQSARLNEILTTFRFPGGEGDVYVSENSDNSDIAAGQHIKTLTSQSPNHIGSPGFAGVYLP